MDGQCKDRQQSAPACNDSDAQGSGPESSCRTFEVCSAQQSIAVSQSGARTLLFPTQTAGSDDNRPTSPSTELDPPVGACLASRAVVRHCMPLNFCKHVSFSSTLLQRHAVHAARTITVVYICAPPDGWLAHHHHHISTLCT